MFNIRDYSHLFAIMRNCSRSPRKYAKNVRYTFSHIFVPKMCKKYVSGGACAEICKSRSCCSQPPPV